jgi:FMN phosphatase YigB (HAD superfamily)
MFMTALAARQGKRLAIYGTGEHTRYIISRLDSVALNGIFLCDNSRVGETFEGLVISDIREVQVDTVVVVARDMVLRLIYERLRDLTDAEIINPRGENLAELFSSRPASLDGDPYWRVTKQDLMLAIDRHGVVSFDLFDTLLMRRIVRPHDELGFESEKKLTVPRKDVVDCFNYALKQQKQVFILSDMYFSSEQLGELLAQNGVSGYADIIVSREHNASKEEGGLYEVLKTRGDPGSILHIGDNEAADIENAHARGLDAFYVMSAGDLLLNSPMYKILNSVTEPADSRILGEFAAAALNTPFALTDGGKLDIGDMDGLADIFFPIIRCLIAFICVELRGRSQDTILLFLTRDGYFIKRVYDLLSAQINKDGLDPLPKALYFPASRDAVSEGYAEYRDNYKRYAEELGILSYPSIVVYDGATRGTTVAGLERIFGRTLELMCLATFNIDGTFAKERAHSMLGDFSYYDPKYYAVKYYELFEIALKSSAPQFLYINESGAAVYGDIPIYENGIRQLQDTLFLRFEELSRLNPGWFFEPPRPGISDAIFGLIEPKYAKVSLAVTKAFTHESLSEGIPAGNWWERLLGMEERYAAHQDF